MKLIKGAAEVRHALLQDQLGRAGVGRGKREWEEGAERGLRVWKAHQAAHILLRISRLS
jgi:hypothetical protein